MLNEDQSKIDLTIDVKKANKIIFPVMLLLIAFIYFLYDNVTGANLYRDLLKAIQAGKNPTLFLLGYLVCLGVLIYLHAVLHAFFLVILGHIKFNNTKVIANKKLMPYVSHDVPVHIFAYRRAIFLPYLILGLFPVGFGIYEHMALPVFAGTLICICFMGDMITLFHLAKVDRNFVAISHPNKYGCILYKIKS